MFPPTTMRLFRAMDLSPYPNVPARLRRIGARRAMAKADPDLAPVLGATVE